MTKHLRLMMLSLLAMICLGGYSQSEGPEVTLDFSDYKGNPWDISTSSYCKETKTLTYGTYTIILTPGASKGFMLSNYKGTGVLQMGNKNASITLPAFNFDVEKIVVVTPSGVGNKKVTQNVYVDEVAVSTQTTGCQSNKEYQIKEEYQKSGNRYVIKVTNGYLTYMSKIQIYKKQGSGKTATTLSFINLVGEGVTLINGKLANGKDFNGYTATEKDNVAGTIAYAASGAGVAVATVDANTGTVTVTPNVYGKTTITATFTPKDTKTYAGSTASYTITNSNSKYYATVADLRKDLNNGTLTANDEVAVKLTDAKVLYVNQWTSNKVDHTQYFVREGNAAISFYDTDIKMSKSAVVNGTFMGKIGSLTGLLVLTKNNNTNPAGLQVKTSTNPAEPIEISTDDIANYVCDLVTVKGATVIGGTECALSNGNNLKPLYYNKFYPKTTSLGAPYANANVDLTSAIVLTYVNKQNELVYELAPADKYSLVYNLSEESVNAIAAKTDVAVSLKRTFYKDGGWNTLCLPFAVNATDFEGAEVREVDFIQSSENTLVFKEATIIEAGKPYLIKWANTSNEVYNFDATFEGANFVETPTSVKVDGITFTGFYNKTTADKLGTSVAAIGAENKLFKVTSGEMKGFRAAFVLNSTTQASDFKVVIDGTTTGIEDLVVDGVKANGRVYNLNGQYVGNSLNGLQPGIYIQNGKKVVVK